MQTIILPVTPLEQNCTLLCCEQSGRAAVVDPGGEVERILQAAQDGGVEIEKLLITHGHFDHIGGAAELAERLGVPIEGPQLSDRFLIDSLPQQCQAYGFPPASPFTPQRWLEHGDTVRFGAQQLEVLHCPGHTPGHIALFHRQEGLALVGDILFRGSIGRTDLPGGDHDTLLRSIHERLLPLGDGVRFIPGHGPVSTFGEERATNPFL
ncbi:MAG TPA: MBL fold metallo-hydrolase [Gammaproteobacteria bacterium]|nr:MBL fold metallo-hydrolase [Gammaproteobacteria bacterium]